jgi:DNA-binding CsgD family transcriptional regulator
MVKVTPGLLERGVELEDELDPKPDFFASACVVLGRRLLYAGELDESRSAFEAAHETAIEQANEPSRLAALLNLSELEIRAGNWDRAGELAREGHEIVEQLGLEQSQSGLLYARALVDAHRGEVESSRREAERAVALAEDVKSEIFRIQALAVLGFLELSRGDADSARRNLDGLLERLYEAGYRNPSFCPMLPNAIEAAIGTGDLDDAERLARELAAAADSPWATAVHARCRGLVAAARGDLGGAVAVLEHALEKHEALPMPFERARTLLALGSVRRRARQRRAARDSLEAALAVFEELGAPLWAEKARDELARIAGRTRAGHLTATESRIAELVSDGRSNKEVAAVLFVSPKTVEYHLGRIYEKLGVHSRTELAHRLRDSA